MWSGERGAVDFPRLDPRKAMLGSNDTRFGQSLRDRARTRRPPGYKKACLPSSPSSVSPSNQIDRDGVRSAVPGGRGAARLPRRGGGRPADGPWPAGRPPPVGPERDPPPT